MLEKNTQTNVVPVDARNGLEFFYGGGKNLAPFHNILLPCDLRSDFGIYFPEVNAPRFNATQTIPRIFTLNPFCVYN